MKKADFITLIVAVAGGLLFSLGMCMCLIPQWNAFSEGVLVAAIGAAVLLTLLITLRIRSGKKAKPICWKMVGKIAFAIISALIFGTGMCLVMVFQQILLGIAVGIVGILLLLCLIPMFAGLK